MNEELQAAAEHIEAYGYCVLKDRILREAALALGRRCLGLHSDPRCQDNIVGDEYYQTLFGMLNQDEEVWSCAFHPDPVALARHFWDRVAASSKHAPSPLGPGHQPQNVHADSAGAFAQVPDVPWDDQQHLDAHGFYRGQRGYRRCAHEPPGHGGLVHRPIWVLIAH